MHRHGDGNTRAEQHHDLHHPGEGVDDEGAVERMHRTFGCEQYQRARAGQRQQRQGRDKVGGWPGTEHADHQQGHSRDDKRDLRQRSNGISYFEDVMHRGSPG